MNSSNLNLGGGSLRVAGRRGEAGTRSCASLCISGWVRVSILAPSGGLRALCTDLDWVGRAIRAPHQVPETDTLKPGWMHDGRCIRCCEKKNVREIARVPWFLASRVCVFRRPRWPVLVCPARFPSLAGPCWSLSPPPHGGISNAESASRVLSLLRSPLPSTQSRCSSSQRTHSRRRELKSAVLSLTSDPAAKCTYVTCTYEHHLQSTASAPSKPPPPRQPSTPARRVSHPIRMNSARRTWRARCPIRFPAPPLRKTG